MTSERINTRPNPEAVEEYAGLRKAVDYMKEIQKQFNLTEQEAHNRFQDLAREAPKHYYLSHYQFKRVLKLLFSDSSFLKDANIHYDRRDPHDPKERSAPIDWSVKIGPWEAWVDCFTHPHGPDWAIFFRKKDELNNEDESTPDEDVPSPNEDEPAPNEDESSL